MEVRQITQAEIARKTGFCRSTISAWMSGQQVPRLDSAKYVSDTCGVPIDIFTSKAVQQIYFGRVYLKNDVSYKRKKRTKEDEGGKNAA